MIDRSIEKKKPPKHILIPLFFLFQRVKQQRRLRKKEKEKRLKDREQLDAKLELVC